MGLQLSWAFGTQQTSMRSTLANRPWFYTVMGGVVLVACSAWKGFV